MNHIAKRMLSFALALCMIAAMIPGFVLGADAAELAGLSDSGIGLEYTAAQKNGTVEWSASGTQIKGSVMGKKGGPVYQQEYSTLTITNNKGNNAKLSFDYTVETTKGLVKIDGTGEATAGTYSYSGTYSVELADQASIQVALEVANNGKQNKAVVTISNLSLAVERDATTTFRKAANGSYTVTDAEGNEVAITADTQLVQHSSKAYTLNAAPGEGYVFFGWYNETAGSYFSYEAQAVYQSDADQTVVPVFVSTSAAIFEVGGAKFTSLNDAGNYAVANGKTQINLISSGTISGDHTIPAGVTLLIPFDDAYTCYTTEPANTGVVKVGTTITGPTPWVQPTAFKTLTMASGANITVNGAISVGGQHTAGNSANGNVSYVGCPSGPVGFIDMAEDSEIVINDNGALYAWGYVIGDGEVTAKSGATVYENMQFTDFRGGSATLLLADPEGLGGELGVFPLSQYYVQNVEAKLTMESGADEYVYTSLFTGNMALSSGVKFMGEGAMFVAENGGWITKEYLPDEDRLLIQVNGNAQINSLSLELAGTAIDSSDYTLPINSNITIQINSGRTVINQNMALLPGSAVTVAKGAELNIAEGWSVYIYDADEWDKYYAISDDGEPTPATGGTFVNQGRKFIALPYSPTRTYTRTVADLTDVKVNLNGTITADGYVYTTIGGADVYSGNGTGMVHLVSGLDPMYTEIKSMLGFGFTYQAIQNGTEITPAVIPTTSIKMHNSDGSYTDSEDAVAGDAYIYHNGKWIKVADATVSFNANGGSGEMTAATVTKDQILNGSNTITLASNAFAKTGYTFQGWATSENGDVVYKDGASVNVVTDLTLYAVWKINTYGVTFNGTDVTSNGAASVQHGSAYSANLTAGQCRVLAAKDITVTIGGKAYTGFTYADGVLSIPADAVTGEIAITAAATVSHTADEAVQENVVAATCKEEGSYDEVVYCAVCDAEMSRTAKTIEKLTTHTRGTPVTENVSSETCEKGGSYDTVVYCTVCDAELNRVTTQLDAPGHTYKSVVTASTCEEQGYTTHTCAVCGDTYTSNPVIKLGHLFTNYKSNGDAACEKDGTKTASCSRGCGKEDTIADTGSALGHDYKAKVTAPTCEEKGYTTYTCARCGGSYVADEVKALGHKYTNYKSNGDATCEKDGTKTASCDNGCGKKNTVADTGSALGHDYKAKVTAPTCEEKGYTTYTCARCGGSYVADEVKALGHKYTDYKSNNDATCEKDGTKTASCDNGCGKKDTVADTGSALGHDYKIVVTAPTCTEQGYSTYTCTRCGNSFVDDTTDATGHHYEDGKCICGDVLKYTITFVDESGKVLQSGIVEHGTVPAYTGETPVKANSATSTFAFSGWTPAVVAAKGDATYTVVFTETLKNGFYNENGGIYHYIDGKLSYAGLIEVDGEYYYVRTTTGEVVTSRTYWVTYTNDLMEAGNYIFDEQGKLIGAPEVVVKNGFYNENGGIYHYVDGKLSYAGLIEVDGEYYYVRTTTGEVVTNRTYWVTVTNDLMDEGNYTFDEQGRMVDTPAVEVKNGFYEENGGIYHYVDGKLSCAGLIKVDGYYYYVRTTTGEVVTSRVYWITVTNDLMEEGNYNFDSKGRMTNPTDGSYVQPEDEVVKNGLVSENGGIYYYENGVMLKCGLIFVDGNYYYVRTTTGEVITGRTYWVTVTNGLIEEGNYTFDAQGRMILN